MSAMIDASEAGEQLAIALTDEQSHHALQALTKTNTRGHCQPRRPNSTGKRAHHALATPEGWKVMKPAGIAPLTKLAAFKTECPKPTPCLILRGWSNDGHPAAIPYVQPWSARARQHLVGAQPIEAK